MSLKDVKIGDKLILKTQDFFCGYYFEKTTVLKVSKSRITVSTYNEKKQSFGMKFEFTKSDKPTPTDSYFTGLVELLEDNEETSRIINFEKVRKDAIMGIHDLGMQAFGLQVENMDSISMLNKKVQELLKLLKGE
jgi:hypothetical protein